MKFGFNLQSGFREFTRMRANACTHTHTHTHTHSLSLSLTHTHTHTHNRERESKQQFQEDVLDENMGVWFVGVLCSLASYGF